MQDKVFIDTNIWLYAFMESDTFKNKISTQLISAKNIILNVQIINEISINLIKKVNYSNTEIIILINNLQKRYTIHDLSLNNIILGTEIREKYHFSYWGSLIVSAALLGNCNILYSEDMHHLQIIEDSLTIINPFN